VHDATQTKYKDEDAIYFILFQPLMIHSDYYWLYLSEDVFPELCYSRTSNFGRLANEDSVLQVASIPCRLSHGRAMQHFVNQMIEPCIDTARQEVEWRSSRVGVTRKAEPVLVTRKLPIPIVDPREYIFLLYC
jgi:hypothetical protein